MGWAHGIDTEFLCYEKRPFTFTEAIALAWVHGVEVRPYPQSLSYVTPIWRAMDRFDVASAKWMPYWSDPPATSDGCRYENQRLVACRESIAVRQPSPA